MPFTIGKVFSDEAMALQQRKLEADRQAELESQNLDLRRRAQMDASRAQGRELDLRQQAQDTSGQDTQARLEMARAEQGITNRKIDLDASQSDRAMAEHQYQFDEDQKYRGAQTELAQKEQTTRDAREARQLDLGTQDMNLRNERAKDDLKLRTRALDISQQNADTSKANSTRRAALLDAQISNTIARTGLTKQNADMLRIQLGMKTDAEAIAKGRAMIQAYEAVSTAGANGQADEASITAAKDRMELYLSAIRMSSPQAYGQVLGSDIPAPFMPPGGKPQSAGDIMKDFMDKPPVVPGGR
jgi:hypothetical protein